jgi:hypothetical protein
MDQFQNAGHQSNNNCWQKGRRVRHFGENHTVCVLSSGYSSCMQSWKKTLLWVLILAPSFALTIVLCLWSQDDAVGWVGSKDTEIIFLVMDAETSQPIPNANVEILREESNFCSNRGKAPFTLVTASDGIARHLATNCMCFGTQGRRQGK